MTVLTEKIEYIGELINKSLSENEKTEIISEVFEQIIDSGDDFISSLDYKYRIFVSALNKKEEEKCIDLSFLLFLGYLHLKIQRDNLSAYIERKAISDKEAGQIKGRQQTQAHKQVHQQIYPDGIKPQFQVLEKTEQIELGAARKRVREEGNAPVSEEEIIQERLFASAEAKAVGEMFASVREAHGISKKGLERTSGIARSNLAGFERGVQSPTLERIQKYADALGYEARVELVPKDNS